MLCESARMVNALASRFCPKIPSKVMKHYEAFKTMPTQALLCLLLHPLQYIPHERRPSVHNSR